MGMHNIKGEPLCETCHRVIDEGYVHIIHFRDTEMSSEVRRWCNDVCFSKDEAYEVNHGPSSWRHSTAPEMAAR